MIWLKQSTSVVISFGPFVDKTDGVTLETGLVGTGANQTENTSTGIRISKNGGAFAARHATAAASSYDAFGNYLVTLDTTDTNTCGVLRMQFADAATFVPVWADYMVVPAMIYDSIIGGTDRLDTNVTHVADTSQTARDLGANITGDIYARLGAPAGASVSADVAAAKSDTAAIKAKTDKLRGVTRFPGTVVSDASNSETTFETNLTETEDDHWQYSFLTFLTGSLAGQTRPVQAYDGSTKFVTTAAFSAEPGAGDTFVLVND